MALLCGYPLMKSILALGKVAFRKGWDSHKMWINYKCPGGFFEESTGLELLTSTGLEPYIANAEDQAAFDWVVH